MKFGFGRVLELASMNDDRREDRQQEYEARDDLIGGVAIAAEPTAHRRCLR